MIISASRRTDIPNYYSAWFLQRLQEGYVLVRNPLNFHQVGKIALDPETVDCIVFWTKNPLPMLSNLEKLQDYCYYFQFTLNPYDQDVEKNVPPVQKRINVFKKLSTILGPARVVWRYDPIFLTPKYTEEYHIENFSKLVSQLKDYTEKCIISFLDFYSKIASSIRELGIKSLDAEKKLNLVASLIQIAQSHSLQLEICADTMDFESLGLKKARCIDAELIAKISGYTLQVKKDRNQRRECGCAGSIDIGAYNTCLNGCKYCYASYSLNSVYNNIKNYCIDFPILCSRVLAEDFVYEREVKSWRKTQLSLFPDNLGD